MYDTIRPFVGKIFFAYLLTSGAFGLAQVYPLVTGIAINGILRNEYYPILVLCICHLSMVALEVCAKMVDTRVFTRVYADFASNAVADAHKQGLPPVLIAGRASLLSEYIVFLERDVPGVMLSFISLGVATYTLFWIDILVGFACILTIVPSMVIFYLLATKSRPLNQGLNDRLEREVELLQVDSARRMRRHFEAVSMWKIKLSDMEARAYGFLELCVIFLFGIALWRMAQRELVEAGTIYVLFTYIWRFVASMYQVPQFVQQIGKLADIDRRLKA